MSWMGPSFGKKAQAIPQELAEGGERKDPSFL